MSFFALCLGRFSWLSLPCFCCCFITLAMTSFLFQQTPHALWVLSLCAECFTSTEAILFFFFLRILIIITFKDFFHSPIISVFPGAFAHLGPSLSGRSLQVSGQCYFNLCFQWSSKKINYREQLCWVLLLLSASLWMRMLTLCTWEVCSNWQALSPGNIMSRKLLLFFF